MTICVLVAHVGLIALRHTGQIALGAAWWTVAGVSVLLVALSPDDKKSGADETLALVVLGSASTACP